MIKYGEVIGSRNRKPIIRIYKEKLGELSPTSLTVTASDSGTYSVGDMVEVSLNVPLFLFSTVTGYALPFVILFFTILIMNALTDNILIIEAVILGMLFVSYFFAAQIAALPFFRRINVCRIKGIIEIEE
ncbi:MAG: SoxR reducing system RseC family protein [Clostridia bacterium]|nr:SoxR reducing system RseC family protein [Clostridia bacterium]